MVTPSGFCEGTSQRRSEEHTSELQSLTNLVCRLLLEKKKKNCRRRILASHIRLGIHFRRLAANPNDSDSSLLVDLFRLISGVGQYSLRKVHIVVNGHS